MSDTQDKPKPPDTDPRLDELLTTIRAALANDAAADMRSAGAIACRAILGALDPTSRANTPATAFSTTPSAPSSTSPLTAALGAFGSIPREQVVEFIVGGLRSILAHKGPTYLTRPRPSPARSDS